VRIGAYDAPTRVSIHAFRGEGDGGRVEFWSLDNVSIHAFRGEGDWSASRRTSAASGFQSTPSGGKATSSNRDDNDSIARFNPRLPGGRRLVEQRLGAGAVDLVSIHAFRGEGDQARHTPPRPIRVSIHAFRGEGDVVEPDWSFA